MDETAPPSIGNELLAQVQGGDGHAADELVRALYPLVWSIVRRQVRHAADHEDVVQEIFMRIFLKLDQYKGVQPFSLWREIFDNLQRQLEEQTPDIPAAAEDTMPSERRNIFDLVEPAD